MMAEIASPRVRAWSGIVRAWHRLDAAL